MLVAIAVLGMTTLFFNAMISGFLPEPLPREGWTVKVRPFPIPAN
ncbi:hypothetical protein [Bacteroides timonensis]|nr:hypothetical protein [Bacteroides timonensis]